MAIEKTTKAKEVTPEIVVAVVKNRYTIMQADGHRKTYEPGNVEMTRDEAEHWYAKSNGTEIIGVPDTGAISGVGAQFKLKKLISDLQVFADDVTAFETDHTGLTEEQRKTILSAGTSVIKAFSLLGSL